MKESATEQNKMGVMPITRLLLSISLPMMFAMLIQSLYNIVDSIFVAKISENALTAVSLAFPIQSIMIAMATGTGVGINALVSMRLGQQEQDKVNKSALNGLFLACCSFVLFFVVGALCMPAYMYQQTSDPEIAESGIIYLRIVTTMSFGLFGVITFDRLLQSTGRTVLTMISQCAGAVFNCVFDPILIFGIGPFPRLGIAGAAYATVSGQILSCILSWQFNIRYNKEIQFSLKGFRPSLSIIRQIYKVGVPSILLGSINSVTSYTMNMILGTFSSTAIAVYGIYFKLISFIFLPVFGLNNGIVPIVAYNFGACNKARIYKTIRTGIKFAFCIMACGTILFELIPARLLQLFNASDHMLAIGVPALRIIAPSFLGAAVSISLSSVFQALRHAFYSMIISFVRQLIVLLPCAYLLSRTGSIHNIWWCFLIAEVSALGMTFFFMGRIRRTVLNTLEG